MDTDISLLNRQNQSWVRRGWSQAWAETNGQTGSAGTGARLTLNVELSLPAVTLNKDGGAQEGCATQRPDEGTQHE